MKNIDDNLALACAGAKKDGKYVFGGEVRITCPATNHSPCEIDRGGSTYEIEVLTDCHGLRWTPTADGWEDAIGQLGQFEVKGNHVSGWSMYVYIADRCGSSGQYHSEWIGEYATARNLALHRALEAMEVTFPKVEGRGHVGCCYETGQDVMSMKNCCR